MLAEERRSKIREILAQKSTVTIAELVESFGTSEMTIRRDLDELEARGVCQRIHGGAMSLRVMEYRNNIYPPFPLREQAQIREKVAIARAATALVRPGDTVAIDSGTTAAYLAQALRGRGPITVISNSLRVHAQLYDDTSINLISPGGTLSLEAMSGPGGDMSFVGPIAVSTLRSFRPTKAFIGTSGLSVSDGISNISLFQAEIKRTLIDIAEEAILITDYTKFGQASGFLVASVQRFKKIITDVQAPARDLASLQAMGIEVLLVEPAQELAVLRPSLIPSLPVYPGADSLAASPELDNPV